MTNTQELAGFVSDLLQIIKQPIDRLSLEHATGSDEQHGLPFHFHLDCSTLPDVCERIWNRCAIVVDVDELVQTSVIDVQVGWDYYADAPKWESQRRSEIEVWKESMTPTEQVEVVVAHIKKCIQNGTMDKLLIIYPENQWA